MIFLSIARAPVYLRKEMIIPYIVDGSVQELVILTQPDNIAQICLFHQWIVSGLVCWCSCR